MLIVKRIIFFSIKFLKKTIKHDASAARRARTNATENVCNTRRCCFSGKDEQLISIKIYLFKKLTQNLNPKSAEVPTRLTEKTITFNLLLLDFW